MEPTLIERSLQLSTNTPVLDRKLQRRYSALPHAARCEDKKPEEERAGVLNRSAADASSLHEVPPSVHDALRSCGNPLDTETRSLMEPRFGHDFSHVRVHTDARAAESARAVNALAYTVGRDIVFGEGRFAPKTAGGRNLLAHELTHVTQQAHGDTVNCGPPSNLSIARADDPFEREADETMKRVASHREKGMESKGPQAGGLHSRGTRGPLLLRQSAGEPKKESKCWITLFGEYCFDVQPEFKTPIGKPPSLRDIQKGWEILHPPGKKQPDNAGCNKFLDFFPARSSDFKGQCCKGRLNDKQQWERTTESDITCCPPDRIVSTALGDSRCCAKGEKAQVGKCVSVPSGARDEGTVSIPASVARNLMPGKLALSSSFLSAAGSMTIDGFGLDNPVLTGESDPKNPRKDYYPNRLVLLDGLAKTLPILLQMDPGATVEIWGHTDATGTEAHNAVLGLQRAQFVKTYLILAGVAPDKLKALSAGSGQPVVKTRAADPHNRRVEIRFKPSGLPAAPQNPATSPTIPVPQLFLPGEGEKP